MLGDTIQCHVYAGQRARVLPGMQDKQGAQQELVYELSEQVAELEERQCNLKRALDAQRQVSNPLDVPPNVYASPLELPGALPLSGALHLLQDSGCPSSCVFNHAPCSAL